MTFFEELVAFVTDPVMWSGPSGIPARVVEHLSLSALSVAIAVVVAVPVGLWIGHTGRGDAIAVAVANIGRAVPSFGVLALALPFTIAIGLGLGFWPTFLALLLLAIPPVFVNAITAVRQVDRATIESARGMGLTDRQVLMSVELPLALSLIVDGIRVAAVQVVATATLAALVGWGGLGRYIVDGLAQRDNAEVFVGAFLVAALAVLTELTFGLIERYAFPAGIRRASA